MISVTEFADKVVLITGASGRIGSQTAIEFSRKGAQLVITGQNASTITKVAQRCTDVSPLGKVNH